MLNIWIGTNKVMRNISIGNPLELDTSSDFDCSLSESTDCSIDVLLGENGSGKSFIGKTIAYLAYIYHCSIRYDSEVIRNMDKDVVIRSLLDAGIGSIDQNQREGCVSVKTSYNGKRRTNFFDELFYNIRIGEKACECFRSHPVIFYSNSQFPSNEFFYGEFASSFSATNVDIIFWNLKNNGNNRSKLKLSLWQNKTASLLGKGSFEPDYVQSIFSDKETLESDLESIKYVHRNIFLFNPSVQINWEDIQHSIIYQKLCEQFYSSNPNPVESIKLTELELKDYYILLLIKRKVNNVDFELLKESVREKYLSSKERYELVLDCLLNINSNPCIFIIDEPENSAHLKIQKKIAQDLPSNLSVLAMTHSPEFVIGLKSQSRNVNVWSIYKENGTKAVENVSKDLITESLDVTAADFFGFAPNLEKWNEKNPRERLMDVDLNALMPIGSFYDAIKSLDEVG
jgi:ABC-type dipeptide/oligopeptide/nickel transport system ATPase component